MSSAADEIATYLTAIAGITHLIAPFDDFNEGQKVLMREYTTGEIDVQVNVDLDYYGRFFTISSEVISCNVDFEVYHEEAFGDLYDEAEETARQYADQAFNFFESSITYEDLKQDVLNNWKSAADYVSRRIAIFR